MNKSATFSATLAYKTSVINSNFRIKVYGLDENGNKVNKLVGVSGLLKLVGDIALVNRLLKRAFGSLLDACICKLRRGVKITFYSK
jgi:hypothetical protein